jgi:hypothetical protein
VAMDDSILRKIGRRIFGSGFRTFSSPAQCWAPGPCCGIGCATNGSSAVQRQKVRFRPSPPIHCGY